MSANQQSTSSKPTYLQVELPNIYIAPNYQVYLWNSQKHSMTPIGHIDQQGNLQCRFQLSTIFNNMPETQEFAPRLTYQPSNGSCE